jgi:hypothetical protein
MPEKQNEKKSKRRRKIKKKKDKDEYENGSKKKTGKIRSLLALTVLTSRPVHVSPSRL